MEHMEVLVFLNFTVDFNYHIPGGKKGNNNFLFFSFPLFFLSDFLSLSF